MPPNRRLSGFFYGKKLALLGRGPALFSKVTLFSLPKVFCKPQICQKCVGDRGSAPDPAGGAHDASPDPLIGWGGAPSFQSSPPRRLDSRAFGAQLLWPPM